MGRGNYIPSDSLTRHRPWRMVYIDYECIHGYPKIGDSSDSPDHSHDDDIDEAALASCWNDFYDDLRHCLTKSYDVVFGKPEANILGSPHDSQIVQEFARNQMHSLLLGEYDTYAILLMIVSPGPQKFSFAGSKLSEAFDRIVSRLYYTEGYDKMRVRSSAWTTDRYVPDKLK